MKKVGIMLAKIAVYFLGAIFILSGIGGIVACTAAENTFTLVLFIMFSCIFAAIGIALFYVSTKKINLNKEQEKTNNVQISPVTLYKNEAEIKKYDVPKQNSNVPANYGNLSFRKTESHQWNVLFGNIPKYIADLIWIKGENCNDSTEPSAIDLSLPISSDSVDKYNSVGYYPNYRSLSPEQRFCYLNWLQDISQPIDIGYVFIFYYGLERHLFFGDFESAYKVIQILRSFHDNGSFQSYSSDAMLFSAAYHKRYDLLSEVNFSGLAPEVVIFLKYGMNMPIESDDLINIRKRVNFNNDRYIKENYNKFKETLDGILTKKYGSPSFPLNDTDFISAKERYPIVLANYSLNNRITFIPDITKNKIVSSAILKILQETHETYKSSKKNSSSKKCNCDGCPKQNSCKYGHVIYDEITRERITLSDKFIMLSVFENIDFNIKDSDNVIPQEFLRDTRKLQQFSLEELKNTLSYLESIKTQYTNFGKCGKAYYNFMHMNSEIDVVKEAIKNSK